MFTKVLEDLARLVFNELDLGLWHYIRFENRRHCGKFIGFLLLVYDIQCHIAMLDWLSVGLDEPAYRFIQDCDPTFDDVYYPPY